MTTRVFSRGRLDELWTCHCLAKRRFRRQFYQFHPDAVQVREIGVVYLVRAILG
jgi:hypothetical protein